MLNTAWLVAVAVTIGAAQAPPPQQETSAAKSQPAAEPQVPRLATPTWTDDRPITRLFQNLGRDLMRLPSADSVLTLGIGGAGALVMHPSDDNLATWAKRRGDSFYTPIGRELGEGWVQSMGALGTYVAGKTMRNAAVTHIGGDLIRAQMLNGIVTTSLKVSINRARPTGGDHSFPSGHTSASFASASVLQGHFGWKVGAPAYAVAGLIGWTRVRDRAHWMSDVLFGAALGTIAGRTVTGSHSRPAWSLVPTTTQGGAALFFVKQSR